jgi:hypothetical protein
MSQPSKVRSIFPPAHPATQPRARPKVKTKATSILDQTFDYTPAVETNLAAKFRAMGFKAKPKKPKFGK